VNEGVILKLVILHHSYSIVDRFCYADNDLFGTWIIKEKYALFRVWVSTNIIVKDTVGLNLD